MKKYPNWVSFSLRIVLRDFDHQIYGEHHLAWQLEGLTVTVPR